MAAIREWFAAYGIIFEYMRELGGEEGLERYLHKMGGELYSLLDSQSNPLQMIEAYFSVNIAKDGGQCTTSLQPTSLTVQIEQCPDHAYFRETPYKSHRFGGEYCAGCAGLYRGMAEAADCGFSSTPPIHNPDATCCSFVFTREGSQ